MSARLRLGLAWFLSVLPLVLAAPVGPGRGLLAIEGASLAGLALLPWLALAGWPGRGDESPLLWLALAAPPVALAGAYDRLAGAAAGPLAMALAAAAGLVLLLADARRAAERSRSPVHAALWTALVPGLAALRVALGFAPQPGSPDGGAWLERAAAASPLVWVHGWARAGGLAEAAFPGGAPPAGLALAGGVLLVVAARAGGGEAGDAP